MLKLLNITNSTLKGQRIVALQRRNNGSIAAEYVAALVILFLFLCFPLINLATVTYKYNLIIAAVHAAANRAAKADKCTGTSGNTIEAVVPASLNGFLNNVNGVTVQSVDWRINESNVTNQAVTRYAWHTKLATVPDVKKLYSVEVLVTASVNPLILINSSIFPSIPGLTGPANYTVTSQELVENVTGLNQ